MPLRSSPLRELNHIAGKVASRCCYPVPNTGQCRARVGGMRPGSVRLLQSLLSSCAFVCLVVGVVAKLNPGLASDPARTTIVESINAGFTWTAPSWQQALTTEEPKMFLAKLWDQSSSFDDSGIPITVFTTLSLERLGQLQNLCESFPGPLVAAIWLPVVISSESENIDQEYYDKLLQVHRSNMKRRERSMQRRAARQQSASQLQSRRAPSEGGRPSVPANGTGRDIDGQLRTQLQQLQELQALLSRMSQTSHELKQIPKDLLTMTGHNRHLMGEAESPAEAPPKHVQQQIDQALSSIDKLLNRIERHRERALSVSSVKAASQGVEGKAVRRLLASGKQQASNFSKDGILKSVTVTRSAGHLRGGHDSNTTQHAHGGATGSSLFENSQIIGRLPPCQLTVMLFVQPFRDPVAPLFLYPINSLRNFASLMARTPLVSMIDVDLTFNSRFMLSLLSNPARVNDLVQDAASGSLLLLPAFEAPLCKQAGCTDGVAAAKVAMHSTKPQLNNLLQRGWLDTFHCSKGTHWAVDYKRWLQSPEAYEVRYARGAEPWFIGHKSIVPWYDTRFKGYGFNKQVQLLYAVGNMRLRLRVLTDAWLIHVPHQHTTVSRAFRAKDLMLRPISTAAMTDTHVDNKTSMASQTPPGRDTGREYTDTAQQPAPQVRVPAVVPPERKPDILLRPAERQFDTLISVSQTVSDSKSQKTPGGTGRDMALALLAAHKLRSAGLSYKLSNLRKSVRAPIGSLTELPTTQAGVPPDQPEIMSEALWFDQGLGDTGIDMAVGGSGSGVGQGHVPLSHERGLRVNAAVNDKARLHEQLLSLYARMFNHYMWPLGRALLLSSEPNRLPAGEHPHVDGVMMHLAACLPWWSNYTTRFHQGQPSSVRPPLLDPPAKPAWPVSWVKHMRAKLEMCSHAATTTDHPL